MTLIEHKRSQGPFTRRRDDYQYMLRNLPGLRGSRPLAACAAELLDTYVRFSDHVEDWHKWSEADLLDLLGWAYEERQIRDARQALMAGGFLIAGDVGARGVLSCRANFVLIAQEIRGWSMDWRKRVVAPIPRGKPRGHSVVSITRDQDKFAPVEPEPPTGTNLPRLEADFGTELPRVSLCIEPTQNHKEELLSDQDKFAPVARPNQLEKNIQEAANGLRLGGLPIDHQTVRIIAGEITKVSTLVEALEVDAFRARCVDYAHSDRPLTWSDAVAHTYSAATRRMNALLTEQQPETDGPELWPGFLFAANQAAMVYAEGQLEALRQRFTALSIAERTAAIEGIKLRIETGEYADAHFVPSLKRYLQEKLWTAHLRPAAKRKGPDTAWLESQLEPEAANGAGNGS